jgi:hypothetical protein
MSYLKATKNNINYRFSLKEANDTQNPVFKPIKTVVVSTSNTLSFGTVNYVNGNTYSVTVKFRTRGDGNSTSSKCSSVGFIANRSDWANSYAYIHSSATAYAERGKIVKWTYTFTATATESRSTALYFIINNAWASGYDNQTIDLYSYEMTDNDGRIIASDENSNENITKDTRWNRSLEGYPLLTDEILLIGVPSSISLSSGYIYNHIFTKGTAFDIIFEAKKSGEAEFQCRFLYGTKFLRAYSMTTEYRVYNFRFISSVTDYSGSRELEVKNSGEEGSYLYIRRLKIQPVYDQMFLQSIRNGSIYYTKLKRAVSSADIPYRMKINNNLLVAQSMGKYKISELSSFTIAELNSYFEY